MISTRVGIQIREALLGSKSSNENKDLAITAQKFVLYKEKLNAFVKALEGQYIAMKQLNESRLLVAECMSEIAKQSPLSTFAGFKRSLEETQLVDGFAPVHDDCHIIAEPNTLSGAYPSFYSTHQSVFERRKMYEKSFSEFVLQYVVDWEQTIVSRIDSALEKAESLRLEVDHYQEKMNSLTSSTTDWSSMLLGKSTDDTKEKERIKRNKIKYQDARNAYAHHAKDLRLLIEEVTDRGWRDLFPVLMKLSLFDSSLASDENHLISELIGITKGMNELAIRYGLKPDSRIQDLGSQDPNFLSTRSEEILGDERSGILRDYEDVDVIDEVSERSSGANDDDSTGSSVQEQKKSAPSVLKPQSIGEYNDNVKANTTPEKKVTFAIDETPKARGSRRLDV